MYFVLCCYFVNCCIQPVVHEKVRFPDVFGGNPDIFDLTIIRLVPLQVDVLPLLVGADNQKNGPSSSLLVDNNFDYDLPMMRLNHFTDYKFQIIRKKR